MNHKYKVGDILCIKNADIDPTTGRPYAWYTLDIILGTFVDDEGRPAYRVLGLLEDGAEWEGEISTIREDGIANVIQHGQLLEKDLGFLVTRGSPLTIVQNFLSNKITTLLDQEIIAARKKVEEAEATINAVTECRRKILENESSSR